MEQDMVGTLARFQYKPVHLAHVLMEEYVKKQILVLNADARELDFKDHAVKFQPKNVHQIHA